MTNPDPAFSQFTVDIESIYPSLDVKTRFNQWFINKRNRFELQQNKDFVLQELTNGERGNNKLRYWLTPNAAARIIFGTDLPVVVQIIKSIAYQANNQTAQTTGGVR